MEGLSLKTLGHMGKMARWNHKKSGSAVAKHHGKGWLQRGNLPRILYIRAAHKARIEERKHLESNVKLIKNVTAAEMRGIFGEEGWR